MEYCKSAYSTILPSDNMHSEHPETERWGWGCMYSYRQLRGCSPGAPQLCGDVSNLAPVDHWHSPLSECMVPYRRTVPIRNATYSGVRTLGHYLGAQTTRWHNRPDCGVQTVRLVWSSLRATHSIVQHNSTWQVQPRCSLVCTLLSVAEASLRLVQLYRRKLAIVCGAAEYRFLSPVRLITLPRLSPRL